MGVLLITQVVLMFLDRMPEAAAWLQARPQHLDAWRMFWLGVLAVDVIEGLAVQAYVLRRRVFPIPDLLLDIIRALFVLAVGFAVMKLQMGIDIAPLLASTALVTAVVGFALQGVLGNLLAGMSLHLVGSFRPATGSASAISRATSSTPTGARPGCAPSPATTSPCPTPRSPRR